MTDEARFLEKKKKKKKDDGQNLGPMGLNQAQSPKWVFPEFSCFFVFES